MSKLAIFLCAVLFTSAVDVVYLSQTSRTAELEFVGTITNAISEVKNKIESTKAKALALDAKLYAAANSYLEESRKHLERILQEFRVDIAKLAGKAEDVDVSECEKFLADLENTGLEVIANIRSCTVGKLETGHGYVQDIIVVSDKVLANLTAIIDEAHHCGDNFNSATSTVNAIVCVNTRAGTASWVFANTVPGLTIRMNKINYLLDTLESYLAQCATTHGLATFVHQSSTIVGRTKQCIQQKVGEVRGETPEVKSDKSDKFYHVCREGSSNC